MNRYKVFSAIGLFILVISFPVYFYVEPQRMALAQIYLKQEYVADASLLYIENCALCHGAEGEGIGPNPALNNPALWTADYDMLYKTIARGRYGTSMTGWHIEEGGPYNDYQIDELVALIRYVEWSQVKEMAAVQGLIPPSLPVPEVQQTLVETITALSAEGSQWAEGITLYAQNCTICHGVNGEGSDLGPALNSAELRTKEPQELTRIISEGVPGTAMAAWKNSINEAEITALVSFLQRWDVLVEQGIHLEAPAPRQINLDDPAEILALGEQLYSSTCSACHGDNGGGGTGPALNSLQFLSRKGDEQIENAIVSGGQRPNSSMPSFGDRLTSVEIGALVDFIRAWEPAAIWVENPRGTEQGGGPPWLRATPDANQPLDSSQRRGGPWWRTVQS